MDSDNSIPDAIQIGDESQPRTLYVGNLDAQMTEEFLVVLFSQIGPVKGCKIIHEILLVAGGALLDVGNVHAQRARPPHRHPLRLQRMAPRPRPPRHYATHPHPNLVPIPQPSNHPSGSGAPVNKPPPRSYKPRLHIPLLSGFGRGPMSRPHNHHHHHHHPQAHPPHHHHHHHPQQHPRGPHHHHHHPHNHNHNHNHPMNHPMNHPHHHGPHQHHHHHPHHHPNQGRHPQPQIVSGNQLPRLQQQHHHQNNQNAAPASVMNVNGKPTGFGFLGEGHSGPEQALPVRQARPNFHPNPPPPHFHFPQDPEMPFGNNDPVSELPTSNGPYHPSVQPILQQTTAAYGDTSGLLGGNYKGWKPIAKPFQNSYPRGPHSQVQPAGIQLQDFPQLQDNHLPAFPDFEGGLTGPPGGSTEFIGGPPDHIEGFPNIPDPPQIPNYNIRVAPTQATAGSAPGGGGSGEGHFLDFPMHGPHMYRGPPMPHSSPPPPPRQPVRNIMFQPIPSSSPLNHQDFSSLPPQSSTTPRDLYPQFHPTAGGGPPGHNGNPNFHNLNTNTLFRENIMHMRPQHHPGNMQGGGGPYNFGPQHFQQAPLGSQEVLVPLPPEIGDAVRLPNSLFTDNSWTQNNREQGFETSQSEENLVIKKPKFGGGRQKQPSGGPSPPPHIGGSEESPENQGPSILPKFKATRVNRLNNNKNSDNNNSNNNENENDNDKQLGDLLRDIEGQDGEGPQKEASQSSDEGGPQGGQSLKSKLNNARGRVRIRTRLRRPNPFQNNRENEDSSQDNGPSDSPTSPPTKFPPFPGVKSESTPAPHHGGHNQRARPIFRKQPSVQPPPDNNLSTESPNSPESPGSEPGPAPGIGGADIKGPISEELSNFPTLPFPPPDPDFIRDFPTPNIPRDSPETPSHPSSSPPPKIRPFGRLPGSLRGNHQHHSQVSNSVENSPADHGQSHKEHPFTIRPHFRRRRPRPQHQKHNEDHERTPPSISHSEPERQPQAHPTLPPRDSHKTRFRPAIQDHNSNDQNDQTPAPGPLGLGANHPLFSDEFFFPPGFNPDPSKVTGDNPVSFITMPNAKPQVIHHDIQRLQPSSHESQPQIQHQPPTPPQVNHRPSFLRPTTQHFPPLEDYPAPIPHNNPPFPRQPSPQIPQHQPQQQQQQHHLPPQHPLPPSPLHVGPSGPQTHQLTAFSEHGPIFPRAPIPRRKPMRANLPPAGPKPQHPQNSLNPYAFPTTNPYGIPTGPPQQQQFLNLNSPSGPRAPQSFEVGDSAPQTSNSYEIGEPQLFGGKQIRQPGHGPVYHGPPSPPPPTGPTPVGLPPVPSSLPPPRHVPVIHGPRHPGRGRLPGGRGPPPHMRKPLPPQHPQPMSLDPIGTSQSLEFEQIPAQYLDVNNLPSTSPPGPTLASPAHQARHPFSKPHVHHSPDIHPPGNFFDDFFKPFDDAFGQNSGATPPGTSRADAMDADIESQSQSNVQLNVVPSPTNQTDEAPPAFSSSTPKPWSKVRPGKHDAKVESSSEKPARGGKKPIHGRFGGQNQEKPGKHHLKEKIADIAKKNFQSHMASAPPADEKVPQVTTYKPALINPSHHNVSKSAEIPVIKAWTDDDDIVDTNIPGKNVRYSSKTDSGPMLIHHRAKDHENAHDGTTILFKSKRKDFRRKRPEKGAGGGEHKDEARPPHPSRNAQHLKSGKDEANDSEMDGGRDAETTRVGVIRRRKLFPRRRHFSLKGSKKDLGEVTESGMGVAEPVTYGESQWFRVEEKSGKSPELSSPVPTPESKTGVPVEGGATLSNISSSNGGDSVPTNTKSNRKSESTSVVSSSSSSTSSSSSSSSSASSSILSSAPKDEKPLGKKSSKFLMSRASIAAAAAALN